jgi:hypothetical protein
LALETTQQLELQAARGNLQAQHLLDRRQALKALSARPSAPPTPASAPERNVPATRSTVTGTRLNALA